MSDNANAAALRDTVRSGSRALYEYALGILCRVLLSRSSQRYAVYAYVFNERTIIVSMILIAALYVRKYECMYVCMYVCRYVLSPRSLNRAPNIL